MKGFLGELQKGLKSPAYVLYSEDPSMLKEALACVRRTVPGAERDFLYHAFDAEAERSMAEAVSALYTVPFFGGRKVVAVENCQRLPKKELALLGDYLSKPSPDSVLIMLFKAKRPPEMPGAGLFPVDIRDSELPSWLRQRASTAGFSLSEDAVDYLLGEIGPEPGLLLSEIEKLASIGKPVVSREDVAGLIRGDGGYDAFKLTDALKKKDRDKVLRIYRALSETTDAQSLLGLINYQYTKAGADPRVFEILSETDIALKSSGSFYPLEYLLLRLLEEQA